MKDKYLIGEVCKLFDITRDTLVHYDRIGLLTPKKDHNNGYRYYDIEDLNCLTDILLFKKLNLPLSDIERVIKDSSPKDILEIVKDKEKALEKELKKINELQKILGAMRLNIQSCIDNLDKIELREEKENLLFIEITKENKFNDFIDIIEGMLEIVEDGKILHKNFLDYVNFSFLVEDGVLFDKNADKKVKWGVTLRKSYNFTEDIMLHERIECIPKDKYMYTIVKLEDGDYDNWLPIIRNIILENNIDVAGHILGRMLLTEYDKDIATDYYEVFIPIK